MISDQLQQQMREVQRDLERAVKRSESKSGAARVWPHLPSEKRAAPTKTNTPQKEPRR